jgi:hypothetical protein
MTRSFRTSGNYLDKPTFNLAKDEEDFTLQTLCM